MAYSFSTTFLQDFQSLTSEQQMRYKNELKTPINVRAPYITIAGQTAPGDGVCVTGASFLLDTHDIIIRHMHFL